MGRVMTDGWYNGDSNEPGPGRVNWAMWGAVIAVMVVGWLLALFGHAVLKPLLMIAVSN